MASATDIEQQAAPPPNDDGVDSSTAVDTEKPASHLWFWTKKALDPLVFGVCLCTIVILVLPLLAAAIVGGTLVSPLVLMLLCSFYKNTAKASSSSSSSSIASIYTVEERLLKETFFYRVMVSSLHLLARSGLVLLLWLLLTLSIPVLNNSTLLGSSLSKWSLLAAALNSSYFVAMAIYVLPGIFRTMAFNLAAYLLCQIASVFCDQQTPCQSLPYMNIYSSFFPPVTLVIYFAIVLVSWVVYFRADDGLGPSMSPRVIECLTWTWVSLFVGSVLLLLKAILVFKWSSSAIYRRFEPRILITTVKFIYLNLTIGGVYDDQVVTDLRLIREIRDAKVKTSVTLTNYIISMRLGIEHIQEAGRSLASLATNVAPLMEDGVHDVINFFENKVTQTYQKCDLRDLRLLLTGGDYGRFSDVLNDEDVARILYRFVKEQCGSDEFTYNDLKKWMVDAHKNCVNMGRTLADAHAMVTCLDIIISIVIWIAVVLLWLMITGIATTTILVTIATPLLTLTFIFGDTAKTFFQGFIFCFGTHPYDVGDRCIIDETELEVKSIGVLTTVFVKIGTMEKRMYPNSLLTTKAIVNLGWQPNPADVVELTLDFSTSPTELQKLETKLQLFFSDAQQIKLFESSHEVMIKEIGDKIKVTIHYIHVLNIKEMTHGECARKKNKQRSILLKKINQFLDHGGVPSNPQVLPEQDPINLLKRRLTF